MIVYVTFLWDKAPSCLGLPAVPVGYAADHVNRLRNMLWRHTHVPHRFILVLANAEVGPPPAGLDPRIEVVNLLDLPKSSRGRQRLREVVAMAGCFRRLYLHTAECAGQLRIHPEDTVVQIDLDCVIAAPITDLVQMPESGFRINSYKPTARGSHPDQRVNGAFQVFRPGALESLYTSLQPKAAMSRIRAANQRNTCIGTDQAWIRLHLYDDLGITPELFTTADGVFEFRQLRQTTRFERITPAPRIVFFAGNWEPQIAVNPDNRDRDRDRDRDPSRSVSSRNRGCTAQVSEWVETHWA